jgi:hypothetical protein
MDCRALVEVLMNQPTIDIGILTIRDDEFRAVLETFPDDHGIYKGRYREYALRTADAGQDARYRVAILRQSEQGNGEAQEAARDLIDDLQPGSGLTDGNGREPCQAATPQNRLFQRAEG